MKKRILKIIAVVLFVLLAAGLGFILWMNQASDKQIKELQTELRDSANADLARRNAELRARQDSVLRAENRLVDEEVERLQPSNSDAAMRITDLEEKALMLTERYLKAPEAEKEIIEREFQAVYDEITRLRAHEDR